MDPFASTCDLSPAPQCDLGLVSPPLSAPELPPLPSSGLEAVAAPYLVALGDRQAKVRFFQLLCMPWGRQPVPWESCHNPGPRKLEILPFSHFFEKDAAPGQEGKGPSPLSSLHCFPASTPPWPALSLSSPTAPAHCAWIVELGSLTAEVELEKYWRGDPRDGVRLLRPVRDHPGME